MRRFALTVLFVLGILVFVPSVVCVGYPYRAGTVAIGAEGSEFQRAFINCTDAITTETLNYAPAWLSGWKYRKKITIDHTKIDSNLKNFPVLVKLTSSNFDFSKARSDGYDIRFTASDGTTLLKYERERHDSANQVAEYWVKIPSVSSSANTEFYIYYGNSSASDGADPTNVWDSYFKAVWHMADTTDSTANNVDGTDHNTIQVDGKIGKARQFDGSSSYIDFGSNSNLDVLPFTHEFWVKIDSSDTDGSYLFLGNNPSCDTKNAHSICWYNSTTNTFKVSMEQYRPSGGALVSNAFSADEWHYLVFTRDDSNNRKIYIDGELDSSESEAETYSGGSVTNWLIGTRFYPAYSEYYLKGIIDESRISNTVRSAAWIKASYYSGNDSLLTYGSEEKSTKVLFLKTDKTNYSLGDVVRLGIKLNYTEPPVYAKFKLELVEPVGEPDVLFQTNLFPLLPGFNVTKILKFKIPQTFWIPEGEYAFKATLTDSLGREIDSDVARFYVNDTLKVHYLEFDAV